MDRGDPIYLASSGPPLTEEFPMGDRNQPLGPYDPTEEDIANARADLDSFDDPQFSAAYVLGWIDSELTGAGRYGESPDATIRRARAMLAAYKARRGAVES
jgi:hypothetical protein